MNLHFLGIFLLVVVLCILEAYEKRENFAAIGAYPPNPQCNACNLEFDGDSVKTECSQILRKEFRGVPYVVAGRSAGRTRQCRRIL